MLDTPEAKEIFASCNRFLTHDYPKTPRQILSELIETIDPGLEADRYGQGDVITQLFLLSDSHPLFFLPLSLTAPHFWRRRGGS